jgi:hypothetical protein
MSKIGIIFDFRGIITLLSIRVRIKYQICFKCPGRYCIFVGAYCIAYVRCAVIVTVIYDVCGVLTERYCEREKRTAVFFVTFLKKLSLFFCKFNNLLPK